jgi:hypothetical protein
VRDRDGTRPRIAKHTESTAGDASSKPVDVEGGSEHVVDFRLEDAGGLVTAKVGAGNAVITAESVGTQSYFNTTKEVVETEGSGEVFGDVGHALGKVLGLDGLVQYSAGDHLLSDRLQEPLH